MMGTPQNSVSNKCEWELDSKLVDRLRTPIHQSWESSAQDLDYDEFDNEDAIEISIDADRLEFLGNDPEANEIISAVIRKYGYQEVLQFLTRNMQVY